MATNEFAKTEPIEPELSEGEKFIEEFFLDEGIEYIPFKRINNLIGDLKQYREADFYLPEYSVYVEFFGLWNDSKEERERYREKKAVYYKNRIPCVYIYPENLGIIEHAFHYRMKKVLTIHKMKKELRKYLLHDFNQQHSEVIPILGTITITVITTLYYGYSFRGFLVAVWFFSTLIIGGNYLIKLLKFLKQKYRTDD